MTTDALYCVWCDDDLRTRIKDYARSMTQSEKRYRSLVAKSWETLGDALPDKTPEHYFAVARYAMHRLRDVYCYQSMPPEPPKWMEPKTTMTKHLQETDSRVKKPSQS